MESPLISINIVTYNRGRLIKKAIDSVLSQSYANWELIIIDDGSTDITKEVLNDYVAADKRIKYYVNPENLGIAKSRNIALEKSSGKYIAVLDSDDYWSDVNKLDKQLTFLQNNDEYVLVGGDFIKAYIGGEEIKTIKNPSSDKQIRKRILFTNPFAHSTVMYKKSMAKQFGGYDETLEVGEDYAMWLKNGRKRKNVYL